MYKHVYIPERRSTRVTHYRPGKVRDKDDDRCSRVRLAIPLADFTRDFAHRTHAHSFASRDRTGRTSRTKKGKPRTYETAPRKTRANSRSAVTRRHGTAALVPRRRCGSSRHLSRRERSNGASLSRVGEERAQRRYVCNLVRCEWRVYRDSEKRNTISRVCEVSSAWQLVRGGSCRRPAEDSADPDEPRRARGRRNAATR